MVSVFADRVRSDTSPLSDESMYAFLDRVAGPVWDRIRDLIEDWVNGYCPSDQAEIVQRLRDAKDIKFTAAYWELLLYHALKSLGFEVSCHPEVPGTRRRPDFLVEGDECSFIMEAKVLGEGASDRHHGEMRNKIYHELNARVHSDDFVVQIQFEVESDKQIPFGKLANAAQSWLDGLDVGEVRKMTQVAGPLGASPYIWEDQSSGWVLALVPILKRTGGSGRAVAIMSGNPSWIDDRTPIRTALYEKAHRYGNELGKPFVVALGLLRPFADDTDIMDALFGSDVYVFDPSTGIGNPVRRPDGLWIGPNGPRSRRLSAVLVGSFVAPWMSARTELKLWKNPWAEYPIDCDAGGAVTIIEPRDDGTLFGIEATITTGELFRLPPDWPGPEPAFP